MLEPSETHSEFHCAKAPGGQHIWLNLKTPGSVWSTTSEDLLIRAVERHRTPDHPARQDDKLPCCMPRQSTLFIHKDQQMLKGLPTQLQQHYKMTGGTCTWSLPVTPDCQEHPGLQQLQHISCSSMSMAKYLSKLH